MDETELKFASTYELYQRILPALKTKVAEFKREKIAIEPLDIWNYCLKNKWQYRNDLRIYELVADILNIDILNLEVYLKKKNKTGD